MLWWKVLWKALLYDYLNKCTKGSSAIRNKLLHLNNRFLKIMLLCHLWWNFLIIWRDQRLRENDQILAINHTPLDQNISHQQAIALLQQTTGSLHLVVAREPVHTKSRTSINLTDTTLPETVSCKFGKIT